MPQTALAVVTDTNDPFDALVHRHYRVVLAVAHAWVRDRALAEEIAQDTFLVAWRRLEGGEQIRDGAAWLSQIARNVARNERRKPRGEPLSDEVADGSKPRDLLAETAVREALDRLAPDYREPLILFYWNGESIHDVARDLGLTETVVKQRLSRGRQKVRDELAQVERTLRAAAPPAAVAIALLASARSRSAEAATVAATAAAPVAAKLGLVTTLLLVGGAVVGGGAVLAWEATRSPPSSSVAAPTHATPIATIAPAAAAATRARTTAPAHPTLARSLPSALPGRPDPTVTMEFKQVPARDVLEMIANASGLDIITAPGFDKRLDLDFKERPVSEVLEYTLHELDAERSDIGIVRVVRDAAATCPELPPGEPVTMRFLAAPVRDVIGALAGSLDRPITIAGGSHGSEAAGRLVDIRFADVPADQALHALLAQEHLGCEIATGILIMPK